MVIVLLKGGLGDQMFQYAAALGIRHTGETLYADLYAFFEKPAAPGEAYRLGIFPALQLPKVPHLVHRIFSSGDFPWTLLRSLLRTRFIRAVQRGSELSPLLQRRRRSLFLDGPFRNPRYFESCRAQLLTDFAFPEPDEETAMMAAAMRSRRDAVSIDIRRLSDDDDAPPEGPSAGYYQECVRRIREQCEQPHFYIVTNDTGWARRLLGLDEPEASFIRDNPERETGMYLMTQCAHHVAAGGAAGWWGAWLSQRKGLSFFPDSWTGAADGHTRVADLVPGDWILVPADHI